MDPVPPFVVSALVDPILFIAGHGDNITGNPTPDGPSNADDDGGIGMIPIVGVVLLGVFAVGMMLWLQRQDREPAAGEERTEGGRALNLKSLAPGGVIAAMIAAPLIIWTASSGKDKDTLIIERWTNDKGKPELLISLTKNELNTLRTANGKRRVRLVCTGRDGEAVVGADAKWPFIKESGYPYPHYHHAATAEQVRRADECNLRGLSVRLAADVEGALQ
jgi:hypothetical protein